MPRLNQRGAAQIILPLFLLAAIGLTVYLAQQKTNLIPFAQETNPPTGCTKITPGTRSVRYKNCLSTSTPCNDQTNLLPSQNGEQDVNIDFQFDGKKVATYALKEVVWDFGDWKLYGTKGPRQADGDRIDISKSRFDSPNAGKSYLETNTSTFSGGYKTKYGNGEVVEYSYTQSGSNLINYQGLPTTTKYDPSRSYAFVPTDPNSTTKCDGTGSTGSKNAGASCSNGPECKSGSCTNQRCDSTGFKTGGTACTTGAECQSNSCQNQRCAGGSKATGTSCDQNSDCASNRCENNRCVSSSSPSPSASRSPSPSPSRAASSAPGASTPASPAPSGSVTPSGSPTASPVPISLTKAEITGFKSNYDLLHTRLGITKDTGNLKVVSTIANNELISIVSQLPTCPDDANVGKCLDDKFRTRFDFAKTAARLSAFYGIFNNLSGLCVKSDFGLNPLITATSVNNTQGRVNLCTEPTAAQKIWRIFIGGKFEPVLAADNRWPANPTCASLPQDVSTHYRNAETLFNTQPGFVSNTLCDGKTLVVPDGSASAP